MKRKEELWEKQNRALRHPSEIFGAPYEDAGITKDSLKFAASASFSRLLHKMGITLVVSREYENLLIALSSPDGKKTRQSFFHLPHPSGMAVDHRKSRLYVAATRNPNQIVEFRVGRSNIDRLKIKSPKSEVLVPARSKFYPGQYYFHDLAIRNDKLYANSVGMNCIIEVDMNSPGVDKPVWWPKCIERNGKPDQKANYIQLNSIALGKSLADSYFSASAAKISARRPGQLNFPVNKTGVIFSGKSREVAFDGLTRPHSARIHDKKVWVANSGYGEVGYYEGSKFNPVFRFNGWTRGLCFSGDILFVGVSRVLPRFRHYAPGIKSLKQVCSVVALDLRKMKKVGEIKFPYGNQIFAIEYLNAAQCKGFPFTSLQKRPAEIDIFSVSI